MREVAVAQQLQHQPLALVSQVGTNFVRRFAPVGQQQQATFALAQGPVTG